MNYAHPTTSHYPLQSVWSKLSHGFRNNGKYISSCRQIQRGRFVVSEVGQAERVYNLGTIEEIVSNLQYA